MLTIDTSNPKAAYIGNPKLFSSAPPIDFGETDLGYAGSQHKFLLKIPEGQVTIDAKRGQIFLIQGTHVKDISAPGSGMNRFITDNLNFKILKSFPDINIDNHYNGIGLHGVYDAKYDRILITKLDHTPLSEDIKYDGETRSFYYEWNTENGAIPEFIDSTSSNTYISNVYSGSSWKPVPDGVLKGKLGSIVQAIANSDYQKAVYISVLPPSLAIEGDIWFKPS